jgi:hypothetical protein
VYDALPLDLYKTDEKTDAEPGSPQVVETLRGVFVAETFHTFQFDRRHVFDGNIGRVLPDAA